MTTWTLPQFLKEAPRRRPGRPSQERYDYWTPEELAIVAKHKGVRGGYRRAAQVLGRTYQSVKAKGAKL